MLEVLRAEGGDGEERGGGGGEQESTNRCHLLFLFKTSPLISYIRYPDSSLQSSSG